MKIGFLYEKKNLNSIVLLVFGPILSLLSEFFFYVGQVPNQVPKRQICEIIL
jgi:hypothetical protein